jgi:hypothetical protein
LSSSNIIIYYLCSDELLKRVVERPQLRKATTVISHFKTKSGCQEAYI